jgi:pectinesterase
MYLMNACRTIFYGEYNCSGPGASVNTRAPYVQRLNDTQAFPFLNTTFIDGDLWLET